MVSPDARGWPVDQGGITPTGDVDRWALIVGISNYQSSALRLRFAARDATTLHETLLEPTAGAFPDDHVLTLVDETATLANLTKALRTFLKKPAAEDLVVIFFACHGSRDRDRPDDLYLLPFDTDPADISGTALPMRDVDFALRQTLHSRRIVALVDACHSGGVGDAFADLRGLGDDAADLNRFLSELSTARGGVSLMTSAMETESSVEGPQWGEGHGVFTHYLLEGLRGKADRPPYDGVVTVGELFDFVADRVKEATDNHQHPHISAQADRSLVLAVTGSLSANQHLELAGRLAEAAELLAEPTCWRGAAVQYGEVFRLRREAAGVEAGLAHALALYRSGDARAAEATLTSRAADGPDARRALGLLQLVQGRSVEARTTLLEPEPWIHGCRSSSLRRSPGPAGGAPGRPRRPRSGGLRRLRWPARRARPTRSRGPGALRRRATSASTSRSARRRCRDDDCDPGALRDSYRPVGLVRGDRRVCCPATAPRFLGVRLKPGATRPTRRSSPSTDRSGSAEIDFRCSWA